MQLRDKAVLVAGASSGIGRALAVEDPGHRSFRELRIAVTRAWPALG